MSRWGGGVVCNMRCLEDERVVFVKVEKSI